MRTNNTKAKLSQGEVVFGAIITRYAPDLVEIMGAIGYDFVMIDCEHGPSDLDQVEHMVRAAEVFGITPIAPWAFGSEEDAAARHENAYRKPPEQRPTG